MLVLNHPYRINKSRCQNFPYRMYMIDVGTVCRGRWKENKNKREQKKEKTTERKRNALGIAGLWVIYSDAN